MKKIFAVLTALIMLFSFTACNNGGETKENETSTTTAADSVTEDMTDISVDENNDELSTEATETVTDANGEEITSAETTLTDVPTESSNPADWTKEQIVAFYRNAAIKSKSVKSTQTMLMTEIVANDGNGFLGTLIEWVTPIFKAALKNNSTEFDGITGGYEKLVPSDVKSAKAYKSGDYTVVEMTMVEQTDGIHGVWSEGTVGHAISVVGDISVVQEELPQFYIDFDNADLKLHYTKPNLKVKINKDGVIEKGTWSYILDVELENLYIEAKKLPIKVMVENGYGSVDYKVTVGGGF